MTMIYEIQHSRSRGKTVTYAWKYGIRATTVFYIHESTHLVQAKPQHMLINMVFARPPNSTLMSLRIQCKRNHNICILHSWVYANILNVMNIDYSPNVFGIYDRKIHVLCIYITVWTYSVCMYYGYCILVFHIRVFTVLGGFCTFSEGYLRFFFSLKIL